jgi:hypothetical protein
MSSDALTKAQIRARIILAARKEIAFQEMMANLATGAERDEHLATITNIKMLLACGEEITAAETRH